MASTCSAAMFSPNQFLHGDHTYSIQAKPFEIFLKKKFEAGHIFQFVSGLITKNVNRTKSGKNRHLGPKREKKERTFFYRLFLSVFIFIFVFMSFFFDA